jgi:uncharacterized protein
MKFEEEFTVEHPLDRTWQFFEDADRLAMCVPGVESVKPGDDGKSRLRMTQAVGYMSATFDLRMQVTDTRPAELLEITSIGRTVKGAAGEMRSVNRVELSGEGDNTHVKLASDVAVGGMLGSVGGKAMAAKAKEVATEFAANVSRELDAWSGGAAAGGGGDTPAATPPAPPVESKPAGWGDQLIGLVRTILAWIGSKLHRTLTRRT